MEEPKPLAAERTRNGFVVSGDKTQVDAQRHESNYPQWHKAIAGGVAGAGARLIVAPLDLLRIRMQLSVKILEGRNLIRRNTFWGHLRQVYQQEGGFTSLFRGNLSATYLWITYSAIQFSAYMETKDALEVAFPSMAASGKAFVGGAVGGFLGTLCTYPLDMCRTTFAAKGLTSSMSDATALVRPPRSMLDFAQQLYRSKGIPGFFAGSGPALLQIIPYMGLNFAIYDSLTTEHGKSVMSSGTAGAISGGISKIVVFPLDTVKRRLQAQAFFAAPDKTRTTYKNFIDCIVRVVREEGAKALFRGIVPSVIKTSMSTSLAFAFFSMTKSGLETIHDSIHRSSSNEDDGDAAATVLGARRYQRITSSTTTISTGDRGDGSARHPSVSSSASSTKCEPIPADEEDMS